MGDLIKQFGIEPSLLIAQIINFGIVLLVLWKFAYKPVLKVLRERQDKVKKSLADAKAVELKLQEAEKMKQEKILEARTEAEKILDDAAQESENLRQQRLKEIQAEVDGMKVHAQAEIVAQKAQALNQAKAEMVDLVISATGKVINKSGLERVNKALVEEAVEETKHV